MRRAFWFALSVMLVGSLLLSSCGEAAPTTTTPETTIPETTIPETTTPETATPETTPEAVEPITLDVSPQYGGVLRYAASGTGWDLKTPDMIQTGVPIHYLLSYAYERLIMGDWLKGPMGSNEFEFNHYTYTPEFVWSGALAESWEVPEPDRLIIHLRQGVRFQDTSPVNGREVVADDIIYSFERYASFPQTKREVDEWVDSYTALDKYTIEVKFKKVVCLGVQEVLQRALIHPREIVDTYGGFEDFKNACGTGPFILKDHVPSSSTTFVRNPTYWGYDELNPQNQLPYVDQVLVLQIFDLSTRYAALRTGKVDFTSQVPHLDAVNVIATSPDLNYNSYLTYLNLGVQCRRDMEPFTDVRVRWALSMALDREAIVRDYYGGKGVVLNSPFMASWDEVYTPIEELPPEGQAMFTYNPERARELLAEAGYPNGFETELITLQNYMEQMQIYQDYWADIGVKVKLRPLEYGTWVSMTYGKTFTAMTAGLAGSTSPVECMKYRRTGAYYNYGYHENPEWDVIYDRMLETQDPVERNKLLKELNVMYIVKGVILDFPAEYQYNFWHSWVKNHSGELVLGTLNYGGIAARVWIDQELRK